MTQELKQDDVTMEDSGKVVSTNNQDIKPFTMKIDGGGRDACRCSAQLLN